MYVARAFWNGTMSPSHSSMCMEHTHTVMSAEFKMETGSKAHHRCDNNCILCRYFSACVSQLSFFPLFFPFCPTSISMRAGNGVYTQKLHVFKPFLHSQSSFFLSFMAHLCYNSIKHPCPQPLLELTDTTEAVSAWALPCPPPPIANVSPTAHCREIKGVLHDVVSVPLARDRIACQQREKTYLFFLVVHQLARATSEIWACARHLMGRQHMGAGWL